MVIPGHNLGNSQVSVNWTIGPTLVLNIAMAFVNMHIVSLTFYAPNFEKVGDILVSACVYVCMYVCVCVCIQVRDIVLKLHVWISHGKIADAYFWFSLNYLPL